MSDEIEQGPFKPQKVQGIWKDDVWFYVHPNGGIEIHLEQGKDYQRMEPHASFYIPPQEYVKAKRRRRVA